MSRTMPPHARTAVLLVAIFAAGTTSVLYRPESGAVSTWWPAAGLSVGLLALGRRSSWPVLLGALTTVTAAANVLGGRPVELSLLLGLCNASEASRLVAGLAACAWQQQRGLTVCR